MVVLPPLEHLVAERLDVVVVDGEAGTAKRASGRAASEPRSEAEPQHLLMDAQPTCSRGTPAELSDGHAKASGACAACGAEAVLWGAAKRRPSAEEADFRAPRPNFREISRALRAPTFINLASLMWA